MNEKTARKLRPFPEGSIVTYNNPGKPRDGVKATVDTHMIAPEGGCYGVILRWSKMRTQMMTISHLRKYYIPEQISK